MVFVGVCRAIYDYAPQSDEELEIKEGDLLFVLERSTEDDWWKCKKKAISDEDDEPEGLVPNNYVEDAQPLYSAKALYDYTQQTDEELSFKEDTRLEVYDKSDPDWALVGSNGQYGFAPAIYIESAASQTTREAPAAIAAPTQQRELAPPPMPTRPVADDEPIPGEADYVDPRTTSYSASGSTQQNPATALAGIIAQKTGTSVAPEYVNRNLASPPLPGRPQYTPEESEEDAPPPMPRRPESQTLASPVTAQPTSPRVAESPRVLTSPSHTRVAATYENEREISSPGAFHMYNIHEMVSHMGKNKKMPTTLGIDSARGRITISPEKSRDGPTHEWTAEKLTHYSIEGKHVFVELVRPSKSVDFHAGARDTAQEIVAALGELAGAVRAEGLREVIAAGNGSLGSGAKTGKMLYEFMAQGADEVTVAEGDEVIVLDDAASDEWWKVRRLKTGKEGVVPSSYVEITGTAPAADVSGLASARSMAESNHREEQRLAMEAVQKDRPRENIPERSSSLNRGLDRRGTQRSSNDRRPRDQPKSKPNNTRVRTWTDRSGTFKVEAEYIGLREGKIHLHKLNGVKIAVPVAKMSVEDLEYVEKVTGASLDEDKPLSDIKRRSTLRLKDSPNPNGAVTAGASIEAAPQHDWFDFFLQCGVNPQICERYAAAFSRDQMSPEVLPAVNEQLLRTLGLKEGDILRVMKHLDSTYDRKKSTGALSPTGLEDGGGLFSGPGGALKNNTRKGRPAPAVQTNDVVDEAAFKAKVDSPGPQSPIRSTRDEPSASASTRRSTGGFDDDAWDVKPSRSQPAPASNSTQSAVPPAPKVVEAPKLINDDIASLAISAPPLQPTQTPVPTVVAPPTVANTLPLAQTQQSSTGATIEPPKPQGADQAIFDKIAALAPQPPRQRPIAPGIPQTNGALMPPPPRAASAPGFNPQTYSAAPLQAQLTGYLPQIAPPGQSLQDLQRLQQLQAQGGFQVGGFNNGFSPAAGFIPQPTGLAGMQQNYPALQPQPTAFVPQGQLAPPGFMATQATGFGQQAPMGFQPQPTGYGQPAYPQQMMNGTQTGSPFADSSRQPFQATPSALSNSFIPAPTGFQPSFSISQPTGMNGMNGFGAQPTLPNPPQLPPQQTGGVFGPSQPIAPLIPQKTGPAPAVRFGVSPGAKPLTAQPTGRANLAKATPQNPFGF